MGSASNVPFRGWNEMTAGFNGFLRVPSGDRDAWLFTLSYSPTSELAFPIPGVAYLWQPSDQLRMNIGLPFLVWYRPFDDLTIDFSYMLIRTVHARVAYRVLPHLRIYTGFDWCNESWLLTDRPSYNDRFFYYDMQVNAGLQFLLGQHAAPRSGLRLYLRPVLL